MKNQTQNKQNKLTQEKLKTLLNYNPETGIFTWKKRNQNISGTINNKGYVVIQINNKIYLAHRLAWLYMTGLWPKNDIDHFNQVRTDNRFFNLREATRKENCQNVHKPHPNNSSGYLGVYWNKKLNNK